MTATTIYCKYCRQRLFDITPGTKGSILIKCSRCRKVIRVALTPEKTKAAAPPPLLSP